MVVFNRGRISALGLARVDLDRTRLSAEVQTNFMPRTLGSMMLRPGLEYIGTIRNSSTAVLLPFIFSATDTALIELTSTAMRVWRSDAVITRAASTAAITGGTFTSTSLAGWTDADESGSTSGWFTGNYMSLVGSRYAQAIRRQTITSTSTSITQGLTTVIARGRVNLRIGSSAGADDYFREASLRPGTYSLAIASTGNFYIEFSANTYYRSLVESIAVESSGDMVIGTTWAGADLSRLRWDPSADVIFVANSSYQQKRIERYGAESWGMADYEPQDGPFRNPNITAKRLTPSALQGNITLECDKPLFDPNHIGALFRITSVGQEVSITLSGADQWSDPIRVTGVDLGSDGTTDHTRTFDISITASSTFTATVRLQRSQGSTDDWGDIRSPSLIWTNTTATKSFDDQKDNEIIFYRIGVGSTYTSGSPVCALSIPSGGITGIVRITSVAAATESSASVLVALGSTRPTELWQEGEWSDFRGWPSAVSFHEGRLYWAGKAKIWGSISDAYESFDPDVEGDSGVINRSIAFGAVDNIEWLASLGRLIIGTGMRELQAKTGSLDEPITPSNFNLRDISNQGSGNVQAVKVDKRLLSVQQGGVRVMETGYSGESLDYETADRTVLVPEMGEPSIARMAVQRQPDTRIHCVRGATDGTVAVLVSDPAEDVTAWIDIETGDADGINGVIEEVAVLPDSVEDAVYYIVRREINGSTVRYLEKWAQEAQGRGGSSNRLADSFTVYDGTAATLIPSTHLVGSSVIAWGSTADLGSYTVDSTGGVTISQASTTVCIGLPYTGFYRTAKLAYAVPSSLGTALTQRKRVNHIGLVLADAHAQGLEYGPSTDTLDPLPLMSAGATISTDAVNATFDEESIEFPGEWDTDSRIVLRATAPRPVTVLGMVIQIETKEKT
ncbi:MAG TPA: hypothetical protein ENH55_13200 [Aurantimonas coralicida]|uniref:Uncharacterized protein n=1 Tax=Aurantimonas coralicida TaxID=182270 RepID=A0A9C9TGC9_9HYPH|nr:hypothetical protein [Aurantimonas coralicida]HET99610.1 hypothetical protein [Aurantimonas coralicida]